MNADIIDQASHLEEMERQHQLNRVRESAANTIKATGNCLNCDEPLDDNRRWCDADCRDDWQRRNPDA